MRRAVRNAACTAIDAWSTEQGTTRVEVDGTCVGPEHGTLLCVETWTSAGSHASARANGVDRAGTPLEGRALNANTEAEAEDDEDANIVVRFCAEQNGGKEMTMTSHRVMDSKLSF